MLMMNKCAKRNETISSTHPLDIIRRHPNIIFEFQRTNNSTRQLFCNRNIAGGCFHS